MTSAGPVRLGEILKAIRLCAPGARVVLKTHHYWVFFRGKVFRGLPKGSGRENAAAEIEFGHVRKMVRMLDLDRECFERMLGFALPTSS